MLCIPSVMRRSLLRALYILALTLCLASTGCGAHQSAELLDTQEDDSAGASKDKSAEQPSKEAPSVLAVYVCGQVARPGVYELTTGSRVCDAIEAAGGANDRADAEVINQAAPLSDGMRLYVPSREETASMDRMSQEMTASGEASAPGSAGGSAGGAVNINTAGQEELMTLSGIGESKAQSIIRYREENGGFSKIEDIMNIRGIKQGIFDQIKDSITV